MHSLGEIIFNRTRLLCDLMMHSLSTKGYNQEESLDYDEIFALVSRLETIRMLLSFNCVRNFKLNSNGCEKCLPPWLYHGKGLC